jgi:ankyrin repeat protein
LQLQALCDEGIKREKDVLIELEKNPSEIGQLYENIFDRIVRSGPSSRDIAEYVLRWLLTSRRPLTTGVILEAVSEAGDDLKKEEVLDYCRNLVIADDETDTFRFAHLSVQEFLVEREGYANDALHTFAALRCLEEFESSRRSRCDDEARPDPNSKSFYAYAVVNWVYHALLVKDRNEDLVEKLESFLRDDEAFSIWNHDALESTERQQYFRAETDFEFPCLNGHKAIQTFVIAKLGLINAFEEHSDLDWKYNNIEGEAPIHVAAFAGNLEIVKRLIEEKEMDVNHQGDTSFGPLVAACVSGHRNVAKYLLSVDRVRVNLRSEFGITPLIAAAKAGNQDMCRILLEHGALVNFQAWGDTALMIAAKFGRLSTVQILLKKGADTEIVNRYKGTALLAAATCLEEHSQDVVELLVRWGANVDAQDRDGNTALHMAAQTGDIDMVRLLIAKKARVSVRNGVGKSALDFACAKNKTKVIERLLKSGATCEPDAFGRTELHEAIQGGCDTNIIKLFVSKGVKVNAKDDNGFSKLFCHCSQTLLIMVGALHLAATRGDKDILLTLVNAGAAIDVKSDSGLTLLHCAAKGGNAEGVEHILSYGVDIEARDNDNMTPLAVACCNANGSDEVVRVLLAAGANISVVDRLSFSPLHGLARYGRTKAALMLLESGKVDLTQRAQNRCSVLDFAAGAGDYKLVRSLLGRGASAQSESGGDSALHFAVRAEKHDSLYAIVERLLEEGCDPNAKNDNGCTPLHSFLAASRGKEDIVRLFLSWGADINIRDDDGNTVLNCLAQYPGASESIIELLLENKANVSLANKKRLTPLHKLARSGLAAHVRILLKAGADPSAKDKHNRQPIQYAVNTNESTIRALLDFDAKVNVTGSDRPSPIVYASSEANLQVLKLLLDGGADVRSEDPGKPGWTALHSACRRGIPDPAFAELLIEHGADVNAVTKISKSTPLHEALRSAAVVQLLLKAGALVDPQNSNGETPLACACDRMTHARVVEILIEAGADPMIKDKTYGATSLHRSCYADALAPIVIRSGKCDDLNAVTKDGSTPLIYAAQSGRLDAVSCLLQTGKAKLDHEQFEGMNAYMFAARYGHTDVLKLLIEYDASIILRTSKRKRSALHMACFEGHLGVVKLLLETDASNIEAVDCTQRTPFDYAAQGGHTDIVALMLKRGDVDPLHVSKRKCTPLLLATWTGKQDLIEMLMAVEGTDLSRATTGGRTLFTAAASTGLEELCRNLIEKGIANGTLPILIGGFSPLHCATDSNKTGVIELLLMQPGVDKNVCSENGYTPLWHSVRKENAKSIMTLLAHHVDVDTPDDRERTPLLIAVQKSNQEIVKMLLNAGAKAQLNEALDIALAKRDKEIIQMLRDSGAVEHDEGFGLEELMMELADDVRVIEVMQATAGAENVEEIPV